MQVVIEAIQSLRRTSGNEQIEILKVYQFNNLLKEILNYTYDPFKVYKVKEKSFDKIWDKVCQKETKGSLTKKEWDVFKFDFLDKFAKVDGVSNKDIEEACEYINHFSSGAVDLLKCVLFKDLKINLGAKTINKVWPELIPDFQCQLAHKLEDIKLPFKMNMASRKLDGLRCLITKIDGRVIAFGRNGKEFPHFNTIKEQLDIAPFDLENYVYDGEAAWIDDNGNEDFQKAISCAHTKLPTEEDKNMRYVMFERIPQDEFFKQATETFFWAIYSNLKTLLGVRDSDLPEKGMIYSTSFSNLYLAQQIEVTTQDYLEDLIQLANKSGWEGLMIREGLSPYEFKRSKKLLKIKKMEEDEFKIVGFEEGQGQLEDTLGAIVIELPTKETVKVGSGYSIDQRSRIWYKKNEILKNENLVLKVQYFEKTQDKKGNNSLRFPVFRSFRDKNTMQEIYI